MAKFYISSTTEDLLTCRVEIGKILRKMDHEIVSMEDYAPQGLPSLEKCRADVARCDFYVGIFAWRYGWSPPNNPAPADNPDGKAITELEYLHAKANHKKCLIFLLDEKAPWPMVLNDPDQTKIRALRKLLGDSEDPAYFQSALELPGSVAVAVVKNLGPAVNPAPSVTAPELCNREIKNDVAIYCSGVDAPFAEALAGALKTAGLKKVSISATLLTPASAVEFEKVEKLASEARRALLVTTDAALPPLAGHDDTLRKLAHVLQARTGNLVSVGRGAASVGAAAQWNPKPVFDASGWLDAGVNTPLVADLVKRLGGTRGGGDPQMIGIPVIVFAMTRKEAAEMEDAAYMAGELVPRTYAQFKLLKEACELMIAQAAATAGHPAPPLAERYADERARWKPFAGSEHTALELLATVAGELNALPQKLGRRHVKLQLYPFDVLLSPGHPLAGVYDAVIRNGCILLADELSTFHPALRTAFTTLTDRKSQVALVSISPLNPRSALPHAGLEKELKLSFKALFDRFSQCDPQFEVMVADELRLKRWLYLSLPQTLRAIQTPAADPAAIDRQFAGTGIISNETPREAGPIL